jgi:ribosomal protein L16 Arg81 hydroxylase
MIFPLDWVLAPVSVEAFRTSYFTRRPLLLQRRRTYYEQFFSLHDLDDALAASRLEASHVNLLQPGTRLPRSVTAVEFRGNSYHRAEIISQKLSEGYTIAVNFIDRLDTRLAHLCGCLETTFEGMSWINAYFSPKEGAGAFSYHFDDHDVFVLQISGSKLWNVFERKPGPAQIVEERELGERILDIELKPGDLLYLPQGQVHRALTQTQHSLHLSLSLSRPKWRDLLSECLATIARDEPDMSESLPDAWTAEGSSELLSSRAQALVARTLSPDLISATCARLTTPWRARLAIGSTNPISDQVRRDTVRAGSNGSTTETVINQQRTDTHKR